MRGLLDAMGATLWGAVAITLAAALAVVGYRASLSPRLLDPGALPENQSFLAAQGPTSSLKSTSRAAPTPGATAYSHGRAAISRAPAANPGVTTAQMVPAQTVPDSSTQASTEDPALTGHYVLPTAADRRMISRVIAKEMTAAQKALQTQQWQEALVNLEAAEQRSGLTLFDRKTIYNFKGFADIKLNNLKAAQGEFEKVLATGDATPEETASMTRTLFTIAAGTQQYQKAIDYGKTLVDNGTATSDNLALIAQSYYLLKNCKDAGIWADTAIAAARDAGETPKENLYLFKLQCASDAGDTHAMEAVLTDLIKLNNKATYWNTLLRLARQQERDDHNTLMIYRIMYNTRSMNADTDYIEMAQLLGDAALPGEAAAVLDQAMASGVIRDEHKERTSRLLAALETRADADRKNFSQQAAEANQSAAGDLLARLGEIYYGFGEYQKSIDAIQQGLQKGSVTRMDEALVYLALSQLQLEDYREASSTLASIPSTSGGSPRLARLWRLYAGSLPTG